MLKKKNDVLSFAEHEVAMLPAGKVMSEQWRYEAIRDGVLIHMVHHRGQITVYLRLNEAKVPAIYGPSADRDEFGAVK